MIELTEFQKKRLENIKRNNDLLKKLNLVGISNHIQKELVNTIDTAKNSSKKHKITKKEAKVTQIPIRRSARLRNQAGDKHVSGTNDAQLKLESEKQNNQEILDKIENTRVVGDIKLSDLIKDDNKDDLMEKFKSYALKNFSSGDFFDELKNHQKSRLELEQLQKSFDLSLYEIFHPNDIKLTNDRVTSIFFHPSNEKKLIIGGDTSGHIGFWNVIDNPPDDELEEPDITKVKIFTKNVGKIDYYPTDTNKILTCSYDGTLRSIHLNNLKSNEILHLKTEYDDYLGISDFQFGYEDPNLLYFTTLNGEFMIFDIRTKPDKFNFKRLSDKKIGSFSINPKKSYEIATGSLDRTLKIWDIRNIIEVPEWSQYSNYPSHEIVAVYDSRLSVSAVSFFPIDGTLVCNGYDDTIRLFDANSLSQKNLNPKITIKHNCQSGRWTSILKTKVKPNMDVFAIANMGRAIDIYNSSGEQLSHLKTLTVPAVLGWHPFENWIVGGNSSGKVFLFLNKHD